MFVKENGRITFIQLILRFKLIFKDVYRMMYEEIGLKCGEKRRLFHNDKCAAAEFIVSW